MAESVTLTPERAVLRDKMAGWYEETKRLVFGEHTCERGWGDFDPSLTEGGGPYHAAFPLLDLFGVVSTPRAHEEFYRNAVDSATMRLDPETRILVSGLASPSMADIVLEEAKFMKPFPGLKHELEGRIDVLDVCATPLLTCQRVFKPEQLAVMAFIQDDAREYASGGPYDLIVTDAFLTRFNDKDKAVVLKNWVKMLADDGEIATTWRIGRKDDEPDYGDEEARKRFIYNVTRRMEEWHVSLGTFAEVNTTLDLAEKYAAKMHSYSGQPEEEIQAFMEKFFGDVRISLSPPVYDVTTRLYARIIARKPKK